MSPSESVSALGAVTALEIAGTTVTGLVALTVPAAVITDTDRHTDDVTFAHPFAGGKGDGCVDAGCCAGVPFVLNFAVLTPAVVEVGVKADAGDAVGSTTGSVPIAGEQLAVAAVTGFVAAAATAAADSLFPLSDDRCVDGFIDRADTVSAALGQGAALEEEAG